jgi:hypothetical protein
LSLAYVDDKKIKRFHFSEIIGRLPYMRAIMTTGLACILAETGLQRSGKSYLSRCSLCFVLMLSPMVGQRLAMLNRWKTFLASSGRMVFDMHHPDHDLAGYHVENASGKSLFGWEALD